jgi:hypothetical protein
LSRGAFRHLRALFTCVSYDVLRALISAEQRMQRIIESVLTAQNRGQISLCGTLRRFERL